MWRVSPPRALLRRLTNRRSQITRCFSTEEEELNRFSKNITQDLTIGCINQPKKQGASQAMLYATGLKEEDMAKPQVGISSVWYEGNPCNMHLLDLAGKVKEGVQKEGMVGYRFNTVGVSDGISMGTRGMGFSLQSRDLIADSIETVMGGQWYDANISLPGCDKNMPGCVMAMARFNRPSIMVYGGTIRAGCSKLSGDTLDIVSAFQSYGQFISGSVNEDERKDIVRNSCPGPGACGGMYTANTMATAIETMGMSLPHSSSFPADSQMKQDECLEVGKAIKNLLKLNIKPRDIMTRESFENAIVITMALGGSTNAVLHLLAMARSAGVKLDIEEFNRISQKVPFIADLKPSGKYVMEDMHRIGGTPAVLKYLLQRGLINGDCMTCTGKTLAENLQEEKDLDFQAQDIIMPLEKPIKSTGHIRILYGNVAPGGAVAKITGKEGNNFTGSALVYDSEEDMLKALEDGKIKKGVKHVIVIRYEGPKGGPGMPEMLTPTSAIVGAGLHLDCALITDGRFSGGSHGFIIGHVTPEAQVGGPIALLEDGDMIDIIVPDDSTKETKATIDVRLSPEEMDARRAKFTPPPIPAERGTLGKFVRLVKSASEGCVTDE